MSSADQYTISCTSVQTVQLCAQKSLTVVKTKMELDLHADTCDQCLDHYRPVNIYGYDPNA